MKLAHLNHLIAVAELGGLRRAARHLGIAQPAITRSIQELEHELGVTLFERSASGMTLTPIGKAFVRRSTAVQQELERARDEVQQLKGISAGTVSIGLSTAPHVSMLPMVLEPFRRRYPEVRLRITEGLFPAMEADIRSGAIDFYVGPLAEETLAGDYIAEKLFDNRRVILAKRGHLLRHATSLAELGDARWVATSVTMDSEAELWPLFQRHGLPKPITAVQAQSALSMITVAAASDILAMLPQQWLAFVRSSRLLVQIKVKEELAAPAICVVFRSRLPLTPVAQHLCDLFRRSALNQPLLTR
ncbi:LysR substrate-binding domain-containing protein [Sphingomonas sp. PAMC 26605]|uniref:LysR substrate-binding domain-containing protein n=1 Tax=Sphingomonas sp. PAMC 26605 TaxID=1112214 RepID=UPI00026CB5F4|nr:LysR substrate-binding domain-containing protein [Sphingomonas sp. PAMC 26605]